MAGSSLTNANIYVVTIKRSKITEPETYYMPAPTPEIATLRVRRVAKANEAVVLSIHTENGQARNDVASLTH